MVSIRHGWLRTAPPSLARSAGAQPELLINFMLMCGEFALQITNVSVVGLSKSISKSSCDNSRRFLGWSSGSRVVHGR